jgi:hypothetical protein
MKGRLAIATMAAAVLIGSALLTTSAWGQRGGRAGFAARGMAGARPAMRTSGAFFSPTVVGFGFRPFPRPFPPFFNGTFPFNTFPVNPFFFSHPFVTTTSVFFNRRFGWGNGFYGGGFYPGYPWVWDSSYQQPSTSAYDQQAYQLQGEVDQLRNELLRLSEEQAESRSEAPPPPTPPQTAMRSQGTPSMPTILVFRDGRTQQVNNYAIANHTLWLLNEQQARRIPLSELNIPATQKANEERGTSFQVPQGR